jgi:hypothetical protein
MHQFCCPECKKVVEGHTTSMENIQKWMLVVFQTRAAAPAPVLGSSRTDVKMVDDSCRNPAAFDTLGDLPDSFNVYYPAPMSTTSPDSHNHGDEISSKKSGNHGDILSSDYGSSSPSVVAHTSPGFTVPAASGSGSEWDPFDALVDLDGVDVDSGHGW